MANTISEAIENLEKVTNGNAMRGAIVDLLTTVNSSGTNAITLDGKTIDYFASAELLNQLIELTTLDDSPTENSSHGVTSGGLYTILTTIDAKLRDILGEEDSE